MRTAIATCLLLAFCSANPLDKLRAGVQKSKNEVQDNIQQLGDLRKSVAQDTTLKVMNISTEQMQIHKKYTDSEMNAIRKEVEAAKAEGKNAQPCYDTAFSTLGNIWRTASSDAQRCIDNVESSLNNELSFIDILIPIARTLKSELDGIFLNCYSIDNLKMQRCIALKLRAANIGQVRILQDMANSAEFTAKSVGNDIVLQGNICIYNVYSPTILQIMDVRLTATKCLKAL